MDIELSEDLQHYKESFILGLTVKQAFFSFLAISAGTAVVVLLHDKIGVTLSCYVATPFVVPLALTGFYNYHGLSFWQFASKILRYSFFNRPLLYSSTESIRELKEVFLEESQEQKRIQEREEKEAKKNKEQKEKSGKKKKREKPDNTIRIITTVVLLLGWGAAAAGAYFYYFC